MGCCFFLLTKPSNSCFLCLLHRQMGSLPLVPSGKPGILQVLAPRKTVSTPAFQGSHPRSLQGASSVSPGEVVRPLRDSVSLEERALLPIEGAGTLSSHQGLTPALGFPKETDNMNFYMNSLKSTHTYCVSCYFPPSLEITLPFSNLLF